MRWTTGKGWFLGVCFFEVLFCCVRFLCGGFLLVVVFWSSIEGASFLCREGGTTASAPALLKRLLHAIKAQEQHNSVVLLGGKSSAVRSWQSDGQKFGGSHVQVLNQKVFGSFAPSASAVPFNPEEQSSRVTSDQRPLQLWKLQGFNIL